MGTISSNIAYNLIIIISLIMCEHKSELKLQSNSKVKVKKIDEFMYQKD